MTFFLFLACSKSYDAIKFFTLNTVQGAGNSNGVLNYSYKDNATSEIVYYRLKQVDFDGKYEYFNIQSVNCKTEELGFSIYPNPTNGIFQIQLSNLKEDATMEIYDLRGRIVLSKILQKETTS